LRPAPHKSEILTVAAISTLLENNYFRAGCVAVLAIFAAWLVELIMGKTLAVAAKRTKTDIDDAVVDIIRRPVFLSVLLYGLTWSTELLVLPDRFSHPLLSLFETLAILIWAMAAMRIGSVLLSSISAKSRPRSMLQPTTLPVFDILQKTFFIAGGCYFVFLAWDIDLTAWLASAGIIGIAVGFAAKDTLANLFSGIFIIADGAYKVKDWITLEDNLRGEITHIGLRSTRILTPDDVEITVPNAVIGNAQVINETGGPWPRQRVRIDVAIAYGSDIDEARVVLEACTKGAPFVLDKPSPAARFRKLGDSGLEFEVWVWIDQPKARESVIDDITSRIYKALNAAKIEIPYSKHDVYIRQMPGYPKV